MKDQAINTKKRILGGSEVFDQTRLQAGGKLLIIPFRAGPDVIATKELDRLALFVIRSINETLVQNNAPLTILDGADALSADLIIKGYITQFDRPSNFKKWIPGKGRLTFGLQAKMTDQETGNVILYFSEQRQSSKEAKDFESLADQIGQDFGSLIIDHLK